MWIELALRGTRFAFIDIDAALYRMHDSNMFKSRFDMGMAFMMAAMLVLPKIPEPLRRRFIDASCEHGRNVLAGAIERR